MVWGFFISPGEDAPQFVRVVCSPWPRARLPRGDSLQAGFGTFVPEVGALDPVEFL